MSELPLFGVFSCIQENHRIHMVVTEESIAQEKLLEYVHLLTKQTAYDPNVESTQLTYFVLENKDIEIFEHTKVLKIDKGWVWNGKKSEIQSKKIGFFKVIPIENKFVLPEITKEQKCDKQIGDDQVNNDQVGDEQLGDEDKKIENEMMDLINQMVDSIHNLHLEIEEPEDNNCNKRIKKAELEPPLVKTSFESMFQPFFDEIKSTNDNQEEDTFPLPISRMSSRGQKCKRRYPYTSIRYGNRFY